MYGVTPLMRDCTDKVKVRNYVEARIGSEYLKPVLQIIGTCHSENLESQNGNSVDFQAVQNLKEEKSKKSQQACCHPELVSGSDIQNKKMLKHACINDEIQNEKINKTAVQHDRPISALHTNFDDVSTYFDRINWDKLPSAFVIKCNHGCKWQYIIKNKEELLKNKRLFELVKKNITGWLEQDYSFWGGFEMNYHRIVPKILIEPLLRDEVNTEPVKINIYCFNGMPKIVVKFFNEHKMSIWNENFEPIKNIFNFSEENIQCKIDDYINQIIVLSGQLAKDFCFVRTDWMVLENKLYFEELTFTPYSGFFKKFLKNSNYSKLLNLERVSE